MQPVEIKVSDYGDGGAWENTPLIKNNSFSISVACDNSESNFLTDIDLGIPGRTKDLSDYSGVNRTKTKIICANFSNADTRKIFLRHSDSNDPLYTQVMYEEFGKLQDAMSKNLGRNDMRLCVTAYFLVKLERDDFISNEEAKAVLKKEFNLFTEQASSLLQKAHTFLEKNPLGEEFANFLEKKVAARTLEETNLPNTEQLKIICERFGVVVCPARSHIASTGNIHFSFTGSKERIDRATLALEAIVGKIPHHTKTVGFPLTIERQSAMYHALIEIADQQEKEGTSMSQNGASCS